MEQQAKPKNDELIQKLLLWIGIPLGVIFSLIIIFLILTPCCAPPRIAPTSAIYYDLKDIFSNGQKINQPRLVIFEKDENIWKNQIVLDLPLNPAELGFFCAGNLCDNDNFEITSNKAESKEKMEIYEVICGNADRPEKPNYCVVFSENAKNATDECTLRCGLNEG